MNQNRKQNKNVNINKSASAQNKVNKVKSQKNPPNLFMSSANTGKCFCPAFVFPHLIRLPFRGDNLNLGGSHLHIQLSGILVGYQPNWPTPYAGQPRCKFVYSNSTTETMSTRKMKSSY